MIEWRYMPVDSKGRKIVLTIIFVLLIISSIFAVSYSYYSSPTQILQPSSLDFQLYNSGCLNITTTGVVVNTTASYLAPTALSPAVTTNLRTVSSNTLTGSGVGVYQAAFENNCNQEVFLDFMFLPNAMNDVNLDDIRFGYCINNESAPYSATHCIDGQAIADYYATDTTGTAYCISPMERPDVLTFIQGISPATNYDSTQDFCEVFYTGIRIPANSYKEISIRYWLSINAVNYSSKRLSGKFIVYSAKPTAFYDSITQSAWLSGDVNQDGYTDRRDALEIEEYVNGTRTSFSGGVAGLTVADVNGDSQINITDFQIVFSQSPVRFGF